MYTWCLPISPPRLIRAAVNIRDSRASLEKHGHRPGAADTGIIWEFPKVGALIQTPQSRAAITRTPAKRTPQFMETAMKAFWTSNVLEQIIAQNPVKKS